MEFRDKLQQLRKQKNLTQEEVADMLFVSRTAISKWESGRGYPSIDSLKAISALFSVSIDNLLSGEELISLAEAENEEKTRTLHYLVFGILDCMMAILFFFPLFGQQGDGMIYNVSLLVLTGVPAYIRVPYILIVIVTVIFGVAMLALQNLRHRIWLKINLATSLSLSILGVLIFIISGQPYVAVFVFCMLIFKGVLLIKQQ
ncbi:putative Xre family DNA-binding protein [uncultured Eubacteriales bacterium]|uniref:Putative Xre family DNA-binding protein n=1 Tax=uncultured Eubacteriales bacterium TaxID=172733 RepID=A0A212K9U5_9FIRM|nr:putative Xre family DNA-binding protein [uncultured Eubacteriales bacterium]